MLTEDYVAVFQRMKSEDSLQVKAANELCYVLMLLNISGFVE